MKANHKPAGVPSGLQTAVYSPSVPGPADWRAKARKSSFGRPANEVDRLPAVGSHLEALLFAQIKAEGLPEPVPQYGIVPGRKFRADLAWPVSGVYVEIDGGTWSGGRHSRGAGIEADCEKTSLAAGLGWRLVRCTARQVESGKALEWIKAALAADADYVPS